MNKQRLKTLARAGFGAKGAIYIIIGVSAAMWAFSGDGGIKGGKGVIQSLSGMTGGNIIVALLGLGLAAYALFRFFKAVSNPSDDGVVKRVGYAASGVAHGFLAFTCAQALSLGSSSGSSKKTYLAELMSSSGGQWVAILGGVAIVGAGAYQLYKAWTNAPAERLNLQQMSRTARDWIVKLGRAGLAARAVIFAIMGTFLVRAGMNANPDGAVSTSGALRQIAQEPMGQVMLFLVAVGLAGYGLYMVASAKYRRVAV